MDRSSNNYQIGTFSQVFDRALGGYEPLPDWAPEEELPNSSLRNVSTDGKQIVVNDEGETGEEKEDAGVLDFDDFFKEEGEAGSEEEQAEEEAAEYYSDEAPEGEYEAPGKGKPKPSVDHEEDDEDEGADQDDELDDFFN
jgi:AP-3 complex subunit beta